MPTRSVPSLPPGPIVLIQSPAGLSRLVGLNFIVARRPLSNGLRRNFSRRRSDMAIVAALKAVAFASPIRFAVMQVVRG